MPRSLTMAYTAKTTSQYATSYWIVNDLRNVQDKKFARVVFYGYASAAAYAAGADPVGEKIYIITGSLYTSLLSRYLAAQAGTGPSADLDLYQLAVSVAPTILDEKGPNGQDGKPTMVSFFAGATAA